MGITVASENKPKPFVKWVGGKRQLLTQFKELQFYPPNQFDLAKNKYFEPFLGGGAVFFDLLPQNAVLSDLNQELITTYQTIQTNVEELINHLKTHENNKEYFLETRTVNPNQLSPLEVASRFIYLNKTCFNGLYRVNKKGEFNVSFGRYLKPRICDERNLRRVSKALQYAQIECSHYQSVLQKVHYGDFVYLDPPYHPINSTSKFTSYTCTEFGTEEHVRLKDFVLELSKKGCFVLLSNSNSAFIKEIYSDIKNLYLHEISANRIVNSNPQKRGKIKEIIVKNYLS